MDSYIPVASEFVNSLSQSWESVSDQVPEVTSHPLVQGAYYDLLMGKWTMFFWALITISTSITGIIVVDGGYELFVWILYLIY